MQPSTSPSFNLQTCSYRRAFSLVELAIVLVILGLLVGGILGGKSLIRASELRSITVEMDKYSVAARSFRDKYFYLPGDMTNATQFWGSLGCPGGVGYTGTCDGDGDGMIIATNHEPELFWQHLQLAAYVPGRFKGKETSGTECGTTNSVSPPARIGGDCWSAHSGLWGSMFNVSNIDTRNSLILERGVMTPFEAWSIDAKVDDGRPARGKVSLQAMYLHDLNECTNVSDANDLDANYLMADDANKLCGLNFGGQF